LSSQVPLGTTRRLEALFPQHRIGYSPEDIRRARAVEDFASQSRIVVGARWSEGRDKVDDVLHAFTGQVLWTDPETAEMCKHALNSYLGLCIAWVNEIARVAEPLGCDMAMITRALRTERRVSPEAPVQAGQPFGGGHLARDIRYLTGELGPQVKAFTPILNAILPSNGPGA